MVWVRVWVRGRCWLCARFRQILRAQRMTSFLSCESLGAVGVLRLRRGDDSPAPPLRMTTIKRFGESEIELVRVFENCASKKSYCDSKCNRGQSTQDATGRSKKVAD